MITAKEAREATNKVYQVHLDSVFEDIRSAAERGESSITVDQDRVSELQVEYLRELDYTVEWISPCLWYEISW